MTNGESSVCDGEVAVCDGFDAGEGGLQVDGIDGVFAEERGSTEFVPGVSTFSASAPLVSGEAEGACCASVILPARNEAASLGMVLDRLAEQRGLDGAALGHATYEVLLLLNNCTDGSGEVARAAARRHPSLRLHVIERELPARVAHVGTARRLLMDTAWHRLRERRDAAILSTDADTVVAKSWIAENLRALAMGADVVGGEICWMPGEMERLPVGVRLAYLRDRRYQRLVAELESRLDPRVEDPMPRHLHHFGASLACTPQAYARAGGVPRRRSLEDVGLVEGLLRVGARLRHDPRVRVYTSGRMEGRVEVGLSGQLRMWNEMGAEGLPHMVPSAAWLVHRFRLLRWLRGFVEGTCAPGVTVSAAWLARVRELRAKGMSGEMMLAGLPAEAMVEESFCGERIGEIVAVCCELETVLRGGGANRVRGVMAGMSDTLPAMAAYRESGVS